MTFWKRHIYRVREQICACTSLGLEKGLTANGYDNLGAKEIFNASMWSYTIGSPLSEPWKTGCFAVSYPFVGKFSLLPSTHGTKSWVSSGVLDPSWPESPSLPLSLTPSCISILQLHCDSTSGSHLPMPVSSPMVFPPSSAFLRSQILPPSLLLGQTPLNTLHSCAAWDRDASLSPASAGGDLDVTASLSRGSLCSCCRMSSCVTDSSWREEPQCSWLITQRKSGGLSQQNKPPWDDLLHLNAKYTSPLTYAVTQLGS